MPGLYFLSDLHLGLQEPQAEQEKLERLEKLFSLIREQGGALYLLGDILDYWMEFRHVVPKGFTRFFCMLSGLVRSGVSVTWFAGNHDFYLGSFFDDELGVKTCYGLQEVHHDGKLFLLAHGDGLGEGDLGYKLFARFIRNRFNLGLLTAFHSDLATALMKHFSLLSRKHKKVDMRAESTRLPDFAAALAQERDFDYFVCGHNHSERVQVVHESGSTYVNLGSWIEGRYQYGVYEQGQFRLEKL
ncbi:UDP-2,3-diacylglucosamine diphosphatase [Chlorobaculum sp. MV4-Y]|uniref:UDP-2,3-diacylglucosamine diphosphatase n=1 Tax=Chlorobaculum sp. MV4-Y TaxID=2976335 RepID=UPI0021AFA0BC|nr:UDP-2,3-diacylglucosamine diphosphatase [Chlorobaculum sp. MV4-Y]UWX57373.1 UDP-2,3-diacylglucosamine diphosphatase [Chlorobaculum sp. MV4-Y]